MPRNARPKPRARRPFTALAAYLAGALFLVSAGLIGAGAAFAAPVPTLAAATSATLHGPAPSRASARVEIEPSRAQVMTASSALPGSGLKRAIVMFALLNTFLLLFLITAREWRALGDRLGLTGGRGRS